MLLVVVLNENLIWSIWNGIYCIKMEQ